MGYIFLNLSQDLAALVHIPLVCIIIMFGENYYVIVRYCYHLIQVWYDVEIVKGEINDAIRTYIHAGQFSNIILCCYPLHGVRL